MLFEFQASANAELNGTLDRPMRSHSMGSIPPQATVSNIGPLVLPEAKETSEHLRLFYTLIDWKFTFKLFLEQEERKPKVPKKDRTQRRKERSRSRSRKSDSFEENEKSKNKEEKERTAAPLVNSETQVITKAPTEITSPVVSYLC